MKNWLFPLLSPFTGDRLRVGIIRDTVSSHHPKGSRGAAASHTCVHEGVSCGGKKYLSLACALEARY